jgi:hypothetical protein
VNEGDAEAPGEAIDRKVIFLLITLIVLIPRISGLYTVHIFDDAFITFRHAENFATAQGLTFNRGTRVLGTTSPLFAVLLSGARFLGLDIAVTAQAIGVISDVATAILTFALVRRSIGRLTAVTAVFIFAVDPHVVRIAVGGMESSLFLALSVTVLNLVVRNPGLAFVVASAACWVRPEGGVLWLASLGALALRWRIRATWAWFTTGVIVTVLPFVFIYLYYGVLLPQSVVSKSHMVSGGLMGVIEIFFLPPGNPAQWALTILTPIGLAISWRRSALFTAALWVAVYVLAYAIARPPMWTWYALPVYWSKTLFAGVATVWLLKSVTPRMLASAKLALAAALLLSTSIAVVSTVLFGASPVRRNVYEPLRDWCRVNPTIGRETIAAGDVGALGFYCNAFIYDLAGLVWPEYRQFTSHLQVVDIKKPDYIFAETSAYWRELYDPTSELRQIYEPVARFSRYGTHDLSPRLENLAPHQVQDYVLFRRVQR